MRYDYDEFQRAIAETTRSLLSKELGRERLLTLVDSDQRMPVEAWHRLAKAGMLGLLVPEEHGGGGGTLLDFCAFAEEAGRALLPGPWLETAVLAPLAVTASRADASQTEWLRACAEGSATAAFAYDRTGGPQTGPVVAERTANGFALRGSLSLVAHGDSADVAVVTATLEDEPALFLVPLGGAGVSSAAVESVDPRETLATLTFDIETAVESLLSSGTVARDVQHRVLATATAVRCVEMLGAARAVIQTTVEHVRAREQFGQPIGAFQAIKHRLATAALCVENLAATAYAAIWAVQQDEDMQTTVSVAKAYASQTYIDVCRTAVQLHGGYGFSWESGIHLYVKHARHCADAFGNTAHHLENLAAHLLD